MKDLLAKQENIELDLTFKEQEKENKRYEDKTQAEIAEEIEMKRTKQLGRMTTIRKWQFGGIIFAVSFYLTVYRKFLHPKAIMNSALQGDSLHLIQNNSIVK